MQKKLGHNNYSVYFWANEKKDFMLAFLIDWSILD